MILCSGNEKALKFISRYIKDRDAIPKTTIAPNDWVNLYEAIEHLSCDVCTPEEMKYYLAPLYTYDSIKSFETNNH